MQRSKDLVVLIVYECCQLVLDDFSSGFVKCIFSILLYKSKQRIKLRPEDSIFLGCYSVTTSKQSESFQKTVVAALSGSWKSLGDSTRAA